MKSVAAFAFPLVLLITALFPVSAGATSSLTFEGGGHQIDMMIGFDERAEIARVRFFAPGDTKGLVLQQEKITVSIFDTERERLALRYAGGDGVAPFTLLVHGVEAVLTMNSRQVRAVFDWTM